MSNDVFGICGLDNTTTALLGGAATFTGEWENSADPDVMVSSQSDVAGTLYFDFSNDHGVTYSTFPTSGFACAAGIHEFHTAVKGPRQFRVRYVNGASAQGSFGLYTYYGAYAKPPNAPLNQAYGLDADAMLVRQTPDWLDSARGLTTGVSIVKKFGRNEAVATTFVPVSIGGVYQTPQAAGATALRIAAGGDANDTADGTGAREVTFLGLDENWDPASEAVATAGASASAATTTTFTRLFRFYVSASGTYATAAAGSHADDITIENSAGGTTWGLIDSTNFPKGQSEVGAYSVATGFTAHVFLTSVSVDSGRVIDLLFFQRTGIDQTAAPYDAMRVQSVSTGIVAGISGLQPSRIPLGGFTGPCDIGFMAKGATTPAVSVEFDIFLVAE